MERDPINFSPEGEDYRLRPHDLYALATALGGTVVYEGARVRVSIPIEGDMFPKNDRKYEISIFRNNLPKWDTYRILFMDSTDPNMVRSILRSNFYSAFTFRQLANLFKVGHPNRNLESIAKRIFSNMMDEQAKAQTHSGFDDGGEVNEVVVDFSPNKKLKVNE